MKFDIPKIVKTLNAGEYAAELGEVKIQVWVNPPRSLLLRYDEAIARFKAGLEKRMTDVLDGDGNPRPGVPLQALGEATEAALAAEVDVLRRGMCEVFAELWSAGPDKETQWSAEEIDRLILGTADTDPQLWGWLRNHTLEMIREHRETVKKG